MASPAPPKLNFLNVERVFVSENGLEPEVMLNWLRDDSSFIPGGFRCHLPSGLHLRVLGVRALCGSSRNAAMVLAIPSLAFCSVNPLSCGMWELECLLALLSTVLTWDLQENDDQTRNGPARFEMNIYCI